MHRPPLILTTKREVEVMIQTVRGAISGDAVSAALPFERVLHRASSPSSTPASSSPSEIRPEDLQEFRRNPWHHNGLNLRLEKEDDAFRELQALAELQSAAALPLVVDVALPSEHRDEFTAKRVQLAERLGMHLVMTATYDAEIQGTSDESERIAKTLETELMFGIGAAGDASSKATSVCAGAIYQPIRTEQASIGPKQLVLLRGLALAQQRTHAPLYLSFSLTVDHNSSNLQQLVLAWLRTLLELGAERTKVVLVHADQWCQGGFDGPNFSFLLSVLELGVSVVFDMIGLSTVSDVISVDVHHQKMHGLDVKEPPRDSTIAAWVSRLILTHGRVEQILLSTNVHQQIQYRRNGGGGYAFLFSFFKPRLLALGVTQQQWTQLVRGNPVALLSWYTPPEAPEVPKHFLTCSICREHFEPIEGEYFTKFAFTYCGTKCLRGHSRLGFVDPPPSPKRKDPSK